MELSNWFFILLWIFSGIELLNLGNQIHQKYLAPLFSQNKKNRSWNAIGKKLGISTQTAINIYNKHIDFLKIKSNKDSFNDTI
jgi:hypothetical protein